MLKNELTEKQKAVLFALGELIRINHEAPTLEELRAYLKYGKISSIQRHLDPLRKKGFIKTEPYKTRGIKLVSKSTSSLSIPLIGNVACGNPLLASENIEAYISYPSEKTKYAEDALFFLRAVGDSMNLAGIDNGDFILVHKQNYADEGQKVVALINDEATVKYFRTKESYISLEPKSSNKAHKPIICFDEVQIQGVVLDVMKI
jgi:repressor LexA